MTYRAAFVLILLLAACDVAQHGPAPTPPSPPPGIPVRLDIASVDALVLFFQGTHSLQPLTFDERGTPVPPLHPIIYLSRNPGVVSVSSTGHLVAEEVGHTWIVGSTSAVGQFLHDSISISVRCTTEGPGGIVSPESATMRVGEIIHPTIRLIYCSGLKETTDVYRWISLDTAVLGVDSISGRLTARAAGETRAIAFGTRYPWDLAHILVQVRD